MNVTREELHRIVDELPEQELSAAGRFLQYLYNLGSDPVLKALLEAPWDDEPETPEEMAAVHEARQQLARGEVLSDEEVWRRLGHEPER